MSTASATLAQTAPPAAELRSTLGHLVCVVGAHGGAGTTRAAVALARDATRDACLIDADLSGGDAHALLELPERPGDVGLAAVSEVAAAVFAHGARRTAFGWLFDVSPRPELAWLIRDADDGIVSVASTRLDGMADFITLPVSHTAMLRSERAASQAAHFLRHGCFDRPEGR